MKTNLIKFGCGMFLLGAMSKATAQSTWNYFITDAGGGNSLVTWNVTGSLATSPGSVLVNPVSSLAMSINAPGIYADSYAAGGTPQAIPTPDGSYFQLGQGDVYFPLELYSTDNAPGNGNDSFGLIAPLPPRTGPGIELLYNPATQSALIPVDFSNFNPGTYQSVESGFDTPVTVNLTVEPVPEPSTLALAVCAVIGALLKNKKARRLRNETRPA